MTLVRRLGCGLCLIALLAWAAPPSAAATTLLKLTEAQLLAVVDGKTLPVHTVSLPLHWDVEYAGHSGQAELRLPFWLDASALESTATYAVSIVRLGVAYEIELNGELVARAGSLVQRDRFYAKHPLRFMVPPRLLRAGANELVVRLRADAGYRAGLAPVMIGPVEEIMPAAQKDEFRRATLPQAASVFSLLVGAFCLLLWWQQRDALYAWAGIGEVLWAVTVADTVVENVPLPWPYWGLTLLLLRAAWAWALYAISEQVFDRGPVLERWAMITAQVSAPLCAVAIAALQSTRPLLVWYTVNFALWLWVIFRLAAQLRANAASQRVLVWLAIVAVVAASARDVVAARLDATLYAESAWAKYLAPAVGITLMWIVSMRFRQARREVLQFNESLTRRVEEKERDLRASFEHLAEVQRERAVLAERERILRDMHDGVGANLATAVRQLEGGHASPDQVARTLRESMDHLKLSIDAMSLPRGDVNALLASLRYRLQPRIESAGLALHWEVAALPLWDSGSDEAMRHLQFMLLEALSNALQHAAACNLTLSAQARHGHIEICLRDDGRGFDVAPARGLRSMQERAAALGATLLIEPARPGTSVLIRLAVG
jgi:signal transduction histidine kinase